MYTVTDPSRIFLSPSHGSRKRNIHKDSPSQEHSRIVSSRDYRGFPPEIALYKGTCSKGEDHTHPSRQTPSLQKRDLAFTNSHRTTGCQVPRNSCAAPSPLRETRNCHSIGRHLAFTVFSAQKTASPCPPADLELPNLWQGASVGHWFALLATSACCPPEPVMNKAPPLLPREETQCCRLRLFHLRTH